MGFIDKASDWARDIVWSPQFASVVALFTTSLLFAPTPLLDRLGVHNLLVMHRSWVGVVWLLSITALTVQVGAAIWRAVKRRRELKGTLSRLDSLNDLEKYVLLFCLAKRQQSINLPLNCDAAKSLVHKHLLSTAPGVGNPLIWAHTIPDHVWKYLCRTWHGRFDPTHVQSQRWFTLLERGQNDWRVLEDLFC